MLRDGSLYLQIHAEDNYFQKKVLESKIHYICRVKFYRPHEKSDKNPKPYLHPLQFVAEL